MLTGDGALQKQHKEVVNHIGRNLHDHKERMNTLKNLEIMKKLLKSDFNFIPTDMLHSMHTNCY